MDLSTLVLLGLNQNQKSMQNFADLKAQDEFYRRKNVMITIGKYNMNSKYTAKNIGRYLKEKNVPVVVPYNILFSDNCSDGKIIDYFLAIQSMNNTGVGKNEYFISEVRKTVEKIDYLRQAQEFGLNN